MLNLFKQSESKKVKSVLSNPQLEYRIIFKKDAVNTIMKAKGWKNAAEMARHLGITRAYMSMLRSTKAGATSTVISRIAVAMGNIAENWWIFFEIVPYGVYDQNHPIWNREKELGCIPYDKYSLSAELRKQDYAVEKVSKCPKM